MSKITLDTTDMTAIGDAIRTKLAVETPYKPGEMPAAILSIPGGGITPTGTINIDSNGSYDVTQYASAEVQVSGGGESIDLSYLPNSIANDVLVSQDTSSIDTNTGRWNILGYPISDNTTTSNSAFIINADGSIQLTTDSYYRYDMGAPNESITIYAVLKKPSTVSGDVALFGCLYNAQYRECPNFYTRNNFGINSSVYGDDTYTGYDADIYRALSISVNNSGKTANFYVDGNKIHTKAFSNSGRGVYFNTSAGRMLKNNCMFKYVGIVAGCESDATIIANMQTIMTKLGINA